MNSVEILDFYFIICCFSDGVLNTVHVPDSGTEHYTYHELNICKYGVCE